MSDTARKMFPVETVLALAVAKKGADVKDIAGYITGRSIVCDACAAAVAPFAAAWLAKLSPKFLDMNYKDGDNWGDFVNQGARLLGDTISLPPMDDCLKNAVATVLDMMDDMHGTMVSQRAEIADLRRSGASDVQTDFSHDLLSANDYYQTPGWLLRDLDGDGIPELLLGANWDEGHTVIFNIYRSGGTRAVRVVNGWNRNRWYLCTDGSLANEGSSSAFESSYSYYRYTSGELQHLETLLYLDDGSGGSPWRYSVTTDQYVNSGDFHSVTEAEATAVMDKYTHETLAFTPFVV